MHAWFCPKRLEYRSGFRGLVLVLATLLLTLLFTACSGETEGAPEAPFGGDLSRPLPYSDVHGLLRLYPGRPAWTGFHALVDGVRERVNGSPLEPLVNIADTLLDGEWLSAGSPLVILFLDPAVHGAMFGFAFQTERARFLQAVDAAPWMRHEDDGNTIVVARRPRQRLLDLLPSPTRMMQSEAEEQPPVVVEDPWFEGSTLRYSLVEDGDHWMLLPQRDGRRNVARVLEVTGVLNGSVDGADYFRLEVGTLLERSREDLRWAVCTPLMALAHNHDFSDFRRFRRQQRRLLTVAEFLLDAAESIEEVYALESDTEWALYLRLRPGSLLDDLRQCLPETETDQLLADAPQGQVVFGVSLDADRLEQLGERIRGKLRVDGEDREPAATQGFERLWLSGSLLSGPSLRGLLARPEAADSVDEGDRFEAAVSGLSEVIAPFFGSELAPRVNREIGSGTTLGLVESGDVEVPLSFGFLPGRWVAALADEPEAMVREELARLEEDPGTRWQRHVSFPERASGVLFLQVGWTLVGALDADNSGLLLTLRPGHL